MCITYITQLYTAIEYAQFSVYLYIHSTELNMYAYLPIYVDI